MRYLYTIALYLLLPFLFLRLSWRARANEAYRYRWSERLGFVPGQALEHSIWVHAVSLGEVIAATPLIKALLQNYPNMPIVVTTTTPTGSAQVKAQFKEQVIHSYLPYDLPNLLKRFLKKTKPRLCLIMETELWPNLLYMCTKHNIPLLLANGRLSPTSMKHYAYIGSLTRKMLNSFNQVAAQSQLDAERFLALGLAAEKLTVTGNVKFDLQLAPDLSERGLALREQLGKDRLVWIAASTHEGEELILLEAFKKLKNSYPNLLLIIVPRHADRFNKVADLCKDQAYKIARRSLQEIPDAETAIYLADTFGEMMLLYAASDIAFVGGSLVAVGGHNVLEPAALALPVLSGPQVYNFTYISELLLMNNALIIVHNTEEFVSTLAQLINDPVQACEMGKRALAVVDANRGAVAKHMALVRKLI